jgi:peptidyl-prolyl cis-trans isomerase B (cyclophilin B)
MIDLDTADLTTLEAVLRTDKGDMVVTFYPEQAPGHVKNFLALAQKGFYDGLAFHRVVRNFMIQGGCPNTRKGAKGSPGTGGPGYQIAAEFNDRPHTRGVLSMARSQHPDSAGSQFFVVHAEHATHLDRQYTVFGKVVEGLDVLDEILSKPTELIGLNMVEVREAEPRAGEAAVEDEGEAAEEGEA